MNTFRVICPIQSSIRRGKNFTPIQNTRSARMSWVIGNVRSKFLFILGRCYSYFPWALLAKVFVSLGIKITNVLRRAQIKLNSSEMFLWYGLCRLWNWWMFPINGDGLDNFHIKSLVFKSYSGSMFAICCQFDCKSVRASSSKHTLYARRQFVDTTKNSKQFELTFYRPHTLANTVRIFPDCFSLFCTLIHGQTHTV